jgi:acetoin utilization deacetylase AcuC-like enzyme
LQSMSDKICDGRITVILEGGYDLEAASACSLSITQALLGREITDALGPSPQRESDRWKPILANAKEIWKL